MKILTVPLCLLSISSAVFAQGEAVVTIKTLAAQMKYDVAEFVVEPGAKVRLTLINEDEMPHNLVVTKPASDKGMALAQAAWALGEKGMELHWVPKDPRVIAATKTIGPHGKEEITFTAPTEAGDYPYVCTFPGHAAAMNGVMQVRAGGGKLGEGPKLADGKFQLFLGKWEMLPDFGQLKALREGPLEKNLIGWTFDDYKNEFGIRFTGKLEVKKEGEHTFRLASDDGARIRINGKTLLAHDGIHPPGTGKTAAIKLATGKHDFQLDYFQAAGGAELYVSWTGPDFGETWLTKTKLESAAKNKKKTENFTGIPLVVKDEAIIYRNFIAGVGARGIAVGLPGGVNAAFDADICNVALVWRGAFIDAKRHWTDRGVGPQAPLGYSVTALDKNVPLAVLPSADSKWPDAPKDIPWGNWPAGYKFGGYTLDKKSIPTFRYTFQGVNVEDRMEAAPISTSHGHSGAALNRVITLQSDKAPADLHFRLASGKSVAAGKNGSFPLEEGVSIKAAGAIVRGSDLLVPVTFKDGKARIEVSYTWNH
jgi:azurin